jgi:hypothetical protein
MPAQPASISTAMRVVMAVVAAATLLLTTFSAAEAGPARPSAKQPVKTTRLATIPFSGEEIPNLLRGQYRWMGYDSQPEGWPGGDTYYRDQMYWGRIEPADNQFNFSYLDTGIADAHARGGKFNFRVMAYCPSCWMNYRADWPAVTPPFLPLKPGTDIPDWNHPAFIAQWEELMAELGRRYGNDDRIGIVDVGGYGKYGEYWTDGEEGKISRANSQRLVGAVVKAFPKAHVVLNTMDPNLVVPAVRKYKNLGLRTDCLGAYNMYSIIPITPALQDVWKRAPVISEWCHTPDATTNAGLKQVRTYHVSMVSSGNYWTPYAEMTPGEQTGWRNAAKAAGYRYAVTSLTTPKTLQRRTKATIAATWRNDGSAPTYDRWKPRIGLRDATGAVVWQTRWKVPLTTMLPGKHRVTTKVAIPASAKKGTYTLVAQVANASSLYAPMNLANPGRDAAGWYPLTNVKVR